LPGVLALAVWSTAAPAAPPASSVGPGPLHVPSPAWREQVIYFLVTDRFADGDARNNDQGAGEYDPGRTSHYSGGDLAGIRRHLDYIQGLGATAVWITPPVANQWIDPVSGHTGYHGYWAQNFRKVDRHLGTLADLRSLSRALHGRGMLLVQDIVLNHTGNFFAYQGGWDAQDPARFYTPNAGSRPVVRPSQFPFSLNDPRRVRDRRAGIYHWTPAITDYNDPDQEARFQMSGLDDLATGNPRVRRALRDSYGWWIREAGIDAFRLDTAFYVPPPDLADFLYAKDPQAPGILEAARRTGRDDFLVFGEGFGIDRPGSDAMAAKIERYMTDGRGRPLLPGMLNFPLYGSLGDVFVRGHPTSELAWRIERMMALHARPQLMPSFVDNHDVDRFLAGGSLAALQQSLLAIFTLPGIPTVYYGTEQGFREPRGSMFAAGFGSGGRDHFDTAAPLYRQLAALSALRRGDRVFTHGSPEILRRSEVGPGALAWRMSVAGRAPAFVVFNTADHSVLLDKLPTGLPAGARLRGRFALAGLPPDLRTGPRGEVTLPLPPRAGWVWQADAGEAEDLAAADTQGPGSSVEAGNGAARAGPWIDAVPALSPGDLGLSGGAAGRGALRIVVDGDLQRALAVEPDAQGRWQVEVDTSDMVDPEVAHEVVAWDPQTGSVSDTGRFRVQRRWQLAADIEDPAGDDAGPGARYRYPTDPSYAQQRTLDLRRVQAQVSGGALQLDLTMAGLTRSWNPANGFDHLVLTVFIELAGSSEPATAVMPGQHAELPQGMRWHRRLRVGGWSNALFSARGASPTSEGSPVTPGARLTVDAGQRTIRLRFPAAALGAGRSLSGARLYVTTWDYDGGYREIATEPGPHVFGGGDPATAPRVMDASEVIVLP
jgi:glycosidase